MRSGSSSVDAFSAVRRSTSRAIRLSEAVRRRGGRWRSPRGCRRAARSPSRARDSETATTSRGCGRGCGCRRGGGGRCGGRPRRARARGFTPVVGCGSEATTIGSRRAGPAPGPEAEEAEVRAREPASGRVRAPARAPGPARAPAAAAARAPGRSRSGAGAGAGAGAAGCGVGRRAPAVVPDAARSTPGVVAGSCACGGPSSSASGSVVLRERARRRRRRDRDERHGQRAAQAVGGAREGGEARRDLAACVRHAGTAAYQR